jgi:antitoxin (DNA-binding transcriptional repressor) of toxin-antitoxin stability system
MITKHGRPVAELVPMAERDVEEVRRAIADLWSLRKGLARRGVRLKKILQEGESLRDLAHEAHRY